MVQPSNDIVRSELPRSELVVERRSQQSVMIGDDIEVIVLDAGSDSVRIGIIAPAGVRVAHGELRGPAY